MSKIVSMQQAIAIGNQANAQKIDLVLTGGCFDILHAGHIAFLKEAKKKGDILMVWIESDKKVNLLKGNGKPLHSQHIRAKILASLSSVTYVVLLPFLQSNSAYEDLVKNIKPAIIAATKRDPRNIHIKRVAKKIGAKVSYVMNRIPNCSTTALAKKISAKKIV